MRPDLFTVLCLEVIRMLPSFGLRRNQKRPPSRSCRPLIEQMESRLQLSAVLWTGAGGDNNWDNANNWNTDTLPGPSDDVTIDTAADVVHSGAVTDSINSLTSTQPLTISGGTLSIAAASSTTGPLVINGGTLTGTGAVTVGGLLTLSSGTLSGTGGVTANGGITINPSATAFNLDGVTLTNAAGQTATWTGTGSNIQASDGAVFNNLGTFQAENQGAFTQGSGAVATFIDAGSFTKLTSSGELDFLGVGFNATGGSVNVQTGTLGLLGGGSQTGAAFSVGSAANLDFGGSTAFSLDSGTTLSGAGHIIKDGPTTLTLPGNSASFTGGTTVNAGTLLVNGSLVASVVSADSGSTLAGTGTVGGIAATGATIRPGDGPGILSVQGNVVLDSSSTFAVALNGPTPEAGYNQLDVTGAVNLAGSTLNASLGFAAPSGESFTIIRSTSPIVGTFDGLPQGGALVIGGKPFQISYTGGTGDNVVLTLVGAVEAPQILSNNSTTFMAGSAGTFTVTSVGLPVPNVSETGALPSGVTFTDNGDGSATLTGTPAAGTGGTYAVTITAANGQHPNAVQAFTLTVNQAPAVTSAAATAFDVGKADSFAVTTSGFPKSTLNESGALPPGVTFVDSGNGTASLAGTPAAGSGGTYNFQIIAANGVGPGASQNFKLTVNPSLAAPTIISDSSTTFAAGAAGTFVVVSAGEPVPSLSENGALPPGVTFVDNGNGTAKLIGTPDASAAGSYHLTITAANAVGAAAIQDFTLNVAITTAPKVNHLQRFGVRAQRTRIVLSFDQPMNLAAAQLRSNYLIRPVVRGRVVKAPRRAIKVASAVYNPANQTVTLTTAKRLSPLSAAFQITVNGEAPSGLTNLSGIPLDGQGNGRAGTNLVMSFKGRASLAGIQGPGQS